MKKTLASYIGVRCIIVSYRKWTKKQEETHLFVRVFPAFFVLLPYYPDGKPVAGGRRRFGEKGTREKCYDRRNEKTGISRKQLTKTLQFLFRSGAFSKAVSCSGVGSGEWREEKPQTFGLRRRVLLVSFRPLRRQIPGGKSGFVPYQRYGRGACSRPTAPASALGALRFPDAVSGIGFAEVSADSCYAKRWIWAEKRHHFRRGQGKPCLGCLVCNPSPQPLFCVVRSPAHCGIRRPAMCREGLLCRDGSRENKAAFPRARRKLARPEKCLHA